MNVPPSRRTSALAAFCIASRIGWPALVLRKPTLNDVPLTSFGLARTWKWPASLPWYSAGTAADREDAESEDPEPLASDPQPARQVTSTAEAAKQAARLSRG